VIDGSDLIAGVLFAAIFPALVLVIVVVGRRNDRERDKYYQRTGKWPRW
jgi:hypothetical protein